MQIQLDLQVALLVHQAIVHILVKQTVQYVHSELMLITLEKLPFVQVTYSRLFSLFVDCPAGQFANETGSSTCYWCSPGTYSLE